MLFRSRDLGKFSLLDKNQEAYPLIYHLYDVNNVFIKVTSAVKDSIIEAFSKGEEYYIQDLQKQNKPQKKSQTEIQVANIPTFKSNNQETILENKVEENQENQEPKLNEQEIMQQEWEKQQQIIARVVNLQQKAKEYNLELLEDIKQRKKEEEKLKKK